MLVRPRVRPALAALALGPLLLGLGSCTLPGSAPGPAAGTGVASAPAGPSGGG